MLHSVLSHMFRVCFPWGFDPLGGILAVFIRVKALLGMSFRVPFDSYSDSGMLHSVLWLNSSTASATRVRLHVGLEMLMSLFPQSLT